MIFFISFILSLCTTIRPKTRVLINLFFYLYTTIRPKLGVTLTLKFILFLTVLIFCLQYCLYISSAAIMPLHFVHYIHRRAAFIFRRLYPCLYEVFTENQAILEPILFYQASKCKQTKEQGSKYCLWTHIFTFL